MQKEIQFRVWDSKLRLLNYQPICFNLDGDINKSFCQFEDVIFQQFTGLLDKNGKKIFEGDIVKFSYTEPHAENPEVFKFFQVIWCDFSHSFQLADESGQTLFHINWRFRDLDVFGEVVGNIFENPELLK